jgi:hypothetical protein
VSIEWLVEKKCTRVYEHYPRNFTFEFGSGALAVDCLCRIVASGRLVLTSQDHGQRFGLPSPVDAYAEAESLLRDRCVAAVRLVAETNDLVIEFEDGSRLEVLAHSSGYELWNLTAPGVHLAAVGGNGIADLSPQA